VKERDFDELVRSALDDLPPQIASRLENVAVVVADEDPEDPGLYGLWERHPYLPDRITIFRRPLERSFPGRAELAEQVRVTVLHELAHYFGIDEDPLDELGYA
jgi:predicted Zn-dependent protease with MMP-like domain